MTMPPAIADSTCRVLGLLAGRVSAATVIRKDEPLARRTTLRVGGSADLYIEPASETDLSTVLKTSAEGGLPVFVLGRGSNLLVSDTGYRGVVICLAHPSFRRVEVTAERLSCGAGARLKDVALEAKRHSLGGLEFLEGIPGSVGGALRMNAGAMGAATFDVLDSARLMDRQGQVRERPASELGPAYRSCPALKDLVALSAIFRGTPAPREEIEQRMAAYSQKRWISQPAAPSAGCMFKNPASIPAGKLIDQLGLKGTRVGGAVISMEHGNFLVNDGTAIARDVLDLIRLVRERAKTERGIELETEVQILGA